MKELNDVNKFKLKDGHNLSPEKMNSIGDSYLKKGDRKTAISYFHKAASELSFIQKDKAVAIYNKIIKISPNYTKAYEDIISIFAKSGLVRNEVSYLIKLAKLYQTKGEFYRVNLIRRRIQQIAPQNVDQFVEDADLKEFVLKDEQANSGNEDSEDPEKLQGEVEAEILEEAEVTSEDLEDAEVLSEDLEDAEVLSEDLEDAEVASEGLEDAEVASEGLEDAEVTSEDKKVGLILKDHDDEGFFPHTPEKSAGTEKTFYIPEEGNSFKNIFIFAGIAVILIVGLVIFFGSKERIKDNSIKDKTVKAWVDNKVHVKSGDYEIDIVRITNEMIDESGISKAINQNDIQKNQFYFISVKAISGCVPEDFAQSPYKMISLVKGEGLTKDMRETRGLNDLSKTFYKSNVAGCDSFSPVFMKFIISHEKGLSYSGISIRGLVKENPVTVKWN